MPESGNAPRGTRKLHGIQVRSAQERDAQRRMMEAQKEAERAQRERAAERERLDAAINPRAREDVPLPAEAAESLLGEFAMRQMERLQKAAAQFQRGRYELALQTLAPLIEALDDLAETGPDREQGCYDFKDEVDLELAELLDPAFSRSAFLPSLGVQTLARELQADCCYYLDDTARGRAAAEAALRWDPWNAQIHLRYASFLEMDRDIEGLDRALRAAYPLIARDLDMAGWHYYRGLELMRAGQLPLAVAHFVAFKDFDHAHELADVDSLLASLDESLHHPGVFVSMEPKEAQRRLRRAKEPYGPSRTGIRALERAIAEAVSDGRMDAVGDLADRYRNLLPSRRSQERLDAILAGGRQALDEGVRDEGEE